MAETSRRGHATRLAQGAAAAGASAVVVLGGDGTLNEAANGLAGTATALGVLPGGSTNVFARTIGMTNDPIEATGELLGAMARHSVRSVGLGQVNGRYFLFHVGMGFDAAVVEQVERRAALKRWAGHPLFIYAGFATWFRHYDRSRPRLAVHAGGQVVDDGYMAIALNTNPYTYLGNRPLNIAPDAGLEDPLVFVTIRTMGFASMLSIAGSALGVGPSLSSGGRRRVAYQPEVDAAVVRGHGPFPYQVDGDFLGKTEALDFLYETDALKLVVP